MCMIVQQQRTSGELLRWSAALLTAAAAAIHFAVTPGHFDENRAFGVFFAAAAWSQLLWALLVTRSDDRRLRLAGVAGNIAFALVWVVSRTTGLPIGLEPGAREAVEFIDVLATIFEVLAAGSISLVPWIPARDVPRRRAATLIAALAIVVIPVTTVAIASDTTHVQIEHDNGGTHEQTPHG
jgi:hypothetical protein